MDREKLLDPEVQAFIGAHENSDLSQLALQRDKYQHLPLPAIIDQIRAKVKTTKKLPLWYKTANILYPKPPSIEQSSSETTAKFKASFYKGKSAVDLTGGFGVDSYYFSKNFTQLHYVEKNRDLAETATHNFKVLNRHNINANISSAEEFITSNRQHFELIYIDPDRRPEKRRVYGFEQSKPDIIQLLPQIRAMSDTVLIKASPMIDLTLATNQLGAVASVFIIAVKNEVKEVLFEVVVHPPVEPSFRCFNILKDKNQVFEFKLSDESQEVLKIGPVAEYLFQPNAAILKAGAFNLVCKRFDLNKLNGNTHLYTGKHTIPDFPGRAFRVKHQTKYNKRMVRALLTSEKANISVRNFPDTAEEVKKKLGLDDGGDQYVFGYRDLNNAPQIAICAKA